MTARGETQAEYRQQQQQQHTGSTKPTAKGVQPTCISVGTLALSLKANNTFSQMDEINLLFLSAGQFLHAALTASGHIFKQDRQQLEQYIRV